MMREDFRRCWTLGRTGRHPRVKRKWPSSGRSPAARPLMASRSTTQGPCKPNPSRRHAEGRRFNPETEASGGRRTTPLPDATLCVYARSVQHVTSPPFSFSAGLPGLVLLFLRAAFLPFSSPLPGRNTSHKSFSLRFAAAAAGAGGNRSVYYLFFSFETRI